MFYTPGWGAVLTLAGTLGGATLTQAVNSATSRTARRKERRESVTRAVSELIASSQAWVYAASTQEQDLFRAIATHVAEEELMDRLASVRAELYSAQLAFGSAIAQVRLTCPPEVVSAAEDLNRRSFILFAIVLKVRLARSSAAAAPPPTPQVRSLPHCSHGNEEFRPCARGGVVGGLPGVGC